MTAMIDERLQRLKWKLLGTQGVLSLLMLTFPYWPSPVSFLGFVLTLCFGATLGALIVHVIQTSSRQ